MVYHSKLRMTHSSCDNDIIVTNEVSMLNHPEETESFLDYMLLNALNSQAVIVLFFVEISVHISVFW